jgi:cytochrome c-type biogenesis protein CcmF
MIAELGHFAIILALAASLWQSLVPLYGAQVNDSRLMRAASPAALAQFALILLSFSALTWNYVTSDFSVLNVYENSHSAKPMLYKISGVWGNHEGSMLLWVLILSAFGAAVAAFGNNLPPALKARVLAVQGMVGLAFLLFIVTVSNPFLRLDPAPIEGSGLNPVLQDPALAFHPPFLYAGYVGLSIAFSFAVAALIEGKVDAAWARWVRPWTLLAWMFLTIGISMGSWWAYYELGWGGWWFWDPVENASLMPWLAATALLHSATVVEKRNALKIWTILLAILSFSLSLMGAFLVRSGVLTSVHAFAVDPQRGLFILVILMVFIGGALSLFALRAPALKQGGLFAPLSREGALVVNNLLLAAATATVLIGTLYPLVLDALNAGKISVGPPYFNLTFVPLMIPLLLLVPLGPMLSWKRADIYPAMQRLWAAAAIALITAIITFAFHFKGPWAAPLAIALGAWLIAGSLSEIAQRAQFFKVTPATAFARLKGLPGQAFGMALAHLGVGVMVIGITAVSAWRTEIITTVKPGDKVEISGMTLTFLSERTVEGPNFTAEQGLFRVTIGDREIGEVTSEKRNFRPASMPTTEAGLYAFWSGDLYVVMGDKTADGTGRTLRAYYNPMVRWIWIGTVIMFLGGLLSLADRRYRVGAPKTAPRAAVEAAA